MGQLEHEVGRGVTNLREGDVAGRDSLLRSIVECDEVAEHRARLVEGAESVVLGHTVLLQEVVLEHACDLKRDLVILAEGALPDKLHDLSKVLLLLQDLLSLRPQLNEARLRSLVMLLEDLGVLRVGEGPVDGREVLALSELLVQAPEDLHDTQSCGCNRV